MQYEYKRTSVNLSEIAKNACSKSCDLALLREQITNLRKEAKAVRAEADRLKGIQKDTEDTIQERVMDSLKAFSKDDIKSIVDKASQHVEDVARDALGEMTSDNKVEKIQKIVEAVYNYYKVQDYAYVIADALHEARQIVSSALQVEGRAQDLAGSMVEQRSLQLEALSRDYNRRYPFFAGEDGTDEEAGEMETRYYQAMAALQSFEEGAFIDKDGVVLLPNGSTPKNKSFKLEFTKQQ